MKTHLVLPLLVAVLSIVTVIALQPNPLVQFEAELASLPEEVALEQLQKQDAGAPLADNITLIHARLSLEKGDLGTAEHLLNLLTADAPNDPAILDARSQVSLLSGDLNTAAARVEAALQFEADREHRERLGLLRRLLRQPEAEIRALQSTQPERLTPWEFDRLVRLLAATRRLDEVESLLWHVSSRSGENASIARKKLVGFLIDEGAPLKAVEAATDWLIVSNLDDDLIETLTTAFIQRGAIGEARQFAETCMAMKPETGFLLMELFYQSGHRLIARELQDTLLSRSRTLSPAEWNILIDFAARTGDLHGLRTAIASGSFQSAPVSTRSDVLLQFLRFQGAASLMPYRLLATDDLLQETPLIGAALAIEQGRLDETVLYLIEASRTDLTGWDQEVWLSIARRLLGTGQDRQLIIRGIASSDLASKFERNFKAPSD